MTPVHYQDNSLEGKRFRLFKYFAVASFLVMVIFSFPFSVYISQKAKDILIKSNEDYAILLGLNLRHQIYQFFYFPVMEQYGAITLRDKKQRDLMDMIIKNTIHGLNVDVVNLYAIDQKVISYSTTPDLIGKKAVETQGYQKAVKGEQSSELLSEEKTLLGLGIERLGSKKKIRTYFPFIVPLPSGGEFISGVLEIVQDMTEQNRSVVKLQYIIFGLSILIMALIFIALLMIVHKAEKIIEQRSAEQRKLEEQLHLAERLAALGEMVAGVSHEIKNPLGIIQSTAELLSCLPDSGERQKQLSGVITEESIRLNNIVTEFLDFARPHNLNLQDCYLEEVIEKNISFLKPDLVKKGIKVDFDSGNRSFKIQGDQELLYRALMNIFINAIQSMDGDGSITVRVKPEKGGYRIDIEDNGSGIKLENLKKIFNPFFTTKEKGSGLGLPIVRKIIEGHKGSIEIESLEGSGTKVIIHLPQKT